VLQNPLTEWLAALFLMTDSKKGISAHQVRHILRISYKSIWFMMRRIVISPSSISAITAASRLA
jgi:hypothetical protein